MTTAFGPQGPNYSTVRPPADPQASGGLDTFFKNCSSAGAKDGTFATADFFNVTLANLRYAVRESGVALNDADDTMVYNAIKAIADAEIALHSSGGVGGGAAWAVDASTTSNTISVSFPTPYLSLPAGLVMNVLIGAPTTGATVINVDALASKAVVFSDGTPLVAGALEAGRIARLIYDGTKFRVSETKQRAFYGTQSGVTLPTATWTVMSPSTKDANSYLATSTFSNGVFTCGAGEAGWWVFTLNAIYAPVGALGSGDAFNATIIGPHNVATQSNVQFVGNQGNSASALLVDKLAVGDTVTFEGFHLQSNGTFGGYYSGHRLGA